MKHDIIAAGLLFLVVAACNLGDVKDSKVQHLEANKNVKELIDGYIKKTPTFGTDQAAEALGNLGDKQAVEPLIALLNTPLNSSPTSQDIKTYAATAIALGKLKDTRAIKPLINNVNHRSLIIANAAKNGLKDIATVNSKSVVLELIDRFKKDDEAAVIALGTIGKAGLEPMLAALKEPEGTKRANAARVLGDIGDPKAIEPLTKNLTDWVSSPTVGIALEKLNWQPLSDADKVHLLIAKSKGEELRNNWQMTKSVLLKHLKSNEPRTIYYALYSFISIGGKDTTDILVKVLKEQGNKYLALAYLNCGEPSLEQAAQDWANAKGYKVVKTAKKDQQTVKWGSF